MKGIGWLIVSPLNGVGCLCLYVGSTEVGCIFAGSPNGGGCLIAGSPIGVGCLNVDSKEIGCLFAGSPKGSWWPNVGSKEVGCLFN